MVSRSTGEQFSDDDGFESQAGDHADSKKRSGLSLKARAVSYLSRREHTRAELVRKLAAYADSPEQVDELLDVLAKEGWQSDERYVQGIIHSKAPAHGSIRIIHTLRQQGLNDDQITLAREQLKETELERAQEVWSKKFAGKGLALNGSEYAKQARFLAARGFSHEIIRQVLKSSGEDEDL